jgi:alpha-beta hydrolase superfamily lysophospholipase
MLVDFRGCGESDGNATTLGYDEARDVAAAVEYVRSRNLPEPIVLYGQSMGAAAVLRAVGPLGVPADGIVLESVFARMLGAVRNRFAMMHVPSFPAAELLVFWGGRQVGFSGFEHNPVEYARTCQCPALLLHGSADRHALIEECRAVGDALTGAKETIVCDEAGHESLYRHDKQRWTEAMQMFLKSIK